MKEKRIIYTLLVLTLLVLTLVSCQKEEVTECWGVVRTITTKKFDWQGRPEFTQIVDTTYQCGITHKEMETQCILNSEIYNITNQYGEITNVSIEYRFFSK